MARHSSNLYQNRSTTQEFLFSHSDDTVEDDRPRPGLTRRASAGTAPVNAYFSDMLNRQRLLQAIASRMGSASALFAIAVRIEWVDTMSATNESTPDISAPDISVDALTPIAAICRSNGGIWARIGSDRWVCVFPDLDAAAGQILAQTVLAAFPEAKKLPVTIGTATYPTANYNRSQIVENAEKALEHAEFYGPGTITAFDAVSLNISGDRRYQAGDIKGAIEEYSKGLLLDPAEVNLHNSLGVCFGVLKQYDNAVSAFENAIWLDPQEVMPIYNKGYILLLKGDRKQALECFLAADDREPNVFEVVFHIGRTYMEMGAFEKARSYLTAATRTNSRSGPAMVSLGACLDKLGLTKEAIQAYKGAVKINPHDAESLSMLGRLYTQRGESLDVAVVLCEQSIQLSPDNGRFRHRLGRIYLKQGQLDQALAAFERAAALGHDSQKQIEETQARMTAAKAC